ncbi:MAG TPA: transglutaminase-like domain-containing protein [Gemmatimonadales bacterium]|nr:transglutaminase-like domain-containing protein [Gemmatimonadales bacterium]
MGWLIKREYFRSTGARLAEAALAVPPGAVFYRLQLGAQQAGYASTTVDTLGDSISVEDVLVVDVPALGKLYRTSGRSLAIVDRALRLRSVVTTVDAAGHRFDARATVSEDSVLHLTIISAADSQRSSVKLTRPIVPPSLLPLRLAFGGELRIGKSYSTRLFDPLTLAERDVTVQVTAESSLIVADSADYDSTTMAWVPVHFDTLRAFRLGVTGDAPGLEAWIDGQGHIVRAQSPLGLTMERTAFELAYENFRHRDTARVAAASAAPAQGDIIAATAIASNVQLMPEQRTTLRVRFSGVPLAGFDLGAGRQALVGDTLTVRRESVTTLTAEYRLPASDTALQRFVRPEPLIQSTDPRVVAQARRIAAGERDPRKVAELLVHWVFQNLKAEISPGVPSAVAVLNSRRGDCNEHTVLYVALARALGLPARTAAGLVYLRGRFYYHAWPEVYLGDWVAVDPTFDQFPADAAHLRFAIGGLARQVELIRLIGSLKLEVL